MRTGLGRSVIVIVSAVIGLGWVGGIGSSATAAVAAAPASRAEARLDRLIDGALRAQGSFFTREEQAVITAKCGYRPGEWDGIDVSMSGRVFHCKNGRRIDDPEIRAVMRAAQPRIRSRVDAVMRRADVRAAIARVAADAKRQALRDLAKRER